MFIINKKFTSFFWTQFLGAFNDNFLKNALVVLVTFKGVTLLGLNTQSLVALAGGLFILPFFLFSPLAGQLSDKFERSKLIKTIKLAEIPSMMLAAYAFYSHNYFLLFITLFLMGLQAALFGPVKFSIIPELVNNDEMTKANAFVEMGTFIAILLGTIGGSIATTVENSELVISACLIVFSILGYITSYFVPSVAIADPQLKVKLNPISEFKALFKLAHQREAIFNSILAISWFWFFGAGVLSVLPIYCHDFLKVDEKVVTLFLTMFTFGVGMGSLLSEKLSFKRAEIGIVPLGSLGLTIFLIDLYFISQWWGPKTDSLFTLTDFFEQKYSIRLVVDFFLMSLFGGLFIVPLYTLLQERSTAQFRSRVIAANNISNAMFMVISSLTIAVFYHFKLNSSQIFMVFALMNMAVAIHVYRVVPEFTLRFYSWILSHVMYKIRVRGLEHIPLDGAVVLAGNHVTFIDWLLISGACKRPSRFVMHYRFFEMPLVKTIFRQAKVIPIAGRDQNEKIMLQAFETVSAELKDQQVVCIFPEGQLTQDGKLNQFRPGISKIIAKDPCPVVPFTIKNLWGSVFSRNNEKKFSFKRRLVELEFYPAITHEKFSVENLEAVIKSRIEK